MNMSFAMTTDQIRNGTKTVTRRLGWGKIKLGKVHIAIEKGQGIPKGGHVHKIRPIVPISSRWEPLRRMVDDPDYGLLEVDKEGFGHLTPGDFVDMLCVKYGCLPSEEFNRIEFFYPRLEYYFPETARGNVIIPYAGNWAVEYEYGKPGATISMLDDIFKDCEIQP